MKILLLIAIAMASCFGLLLVIQNRADVSASVLSCKPDGSEAVVLIHYRSRLPRIVKLSYDLCLIRDHLDASDVQPPDPGGPIKIRHITAVILAPKEEREEPVRIAYPPRIYVANAIITNLTYE